MESVSLNISTTAVPLALFISTLDVAPGGAEKVLDDNVDRVDEVEVKPEVRIESEETGGLDV